jgi:L-asparagine oxygenase
VQEIEQFVTEAQLQAGMLSEDLRRQLLRFRRFGHVRGGILLRGLPVGTIPETPEHADFAVGTQLPAAAIMSTAIAVLGDQYGFAPELGGNIVQDILPVRGFEETQQSIGATVDLLRHVEMAFLEHRADYVALFCVRSDHAHTALTTLSSIDDMLPLLSATNAAILRQPRFRTTVDASFLRGSGIPGPIWEERICALSGPEQRPWLRIDFAETEGMDPAAQAALYELSAAAREVCFGIALEPGDLLCIDNRRSFHGRTPFQPRYDGYDRWLLRSFLTKDLSRSEGLRPGDGRVLQPRYSERSAPLTSTAGVS